MEQKIDLIKKLQKDGHIFWVGGSMNLYFRGILNRDVNDVDIIVDNDYELSQFENKYKLSSDDYEVERHEGSISHIMGKINGIKVCVFKTNVTTCKLIQLDDEIIRLDAIENIIPAKEEYVENCKNLISQNQKSFNAIINPSKELTIATNKTIMMLYERLVKHEGDLINIYKYLLKK